VPVLVAGIDDLVICIFNPTYPDSAEQKTETQSTVVDFCNAAIATVEREHHVECSVVISEIHRGAADMHAPYVEVLDYFEYKRITGNQAKLLQYTDYNVSFDSWYSFGSTYSKFEEVRRIIISVHVGDYANAKKLITRLIADDYSIRYPSLKLARCRLFSIIDLALNAMGLIKDDMDEETLKELDATTRIVNCQTYAEIQEQISAIFDVIIAYFSDKNRESPPDWFETTLQYIAKHYSDPEMNVAAVANHFHISAAYYARVFKKYTGTAPLDHIHKLRMNSAKELMAKGLTVKDAASIVGYRNPLTMSRAFKRYEGITPGKYTQQQGAGRKR
jgi:AraC-like DNA-binding protein